VFRRTDGGGRLRIDPLLSISLDFPAVLGLRNWWVELDDRVETTRSGIADSARQESIVT
jgi:hypothetical protein